MKETFSVALHRFILRRNRNHACHYEYSRGYFGSHGESYVFWDETSYHVFCVALEGQWNEKKRVVIKASDPRIKVALKKMVDKYLKMR